MVKNIWQKAAVIFKKNGYVFTLTGKWVYLLRSVLLSIPVLVCACALAMRNMRLLPASVGINLLSSGEYQLMVTRNVAVLAPLAVTAVCLLLVFCSKKILYPWMISVFSLILPILIWVTNVFPA